MYEEGKIYRILLNITEILNNKRLLMKFLDNNNSVLENIRFVYSLYRLSIRVIRFLFLRKQLQFQISDKKN